MIREREINHRQYEGMELLLRGKNELTSDKYEDRIVKSEYVRWSDRSKSYKKHIQSGRKVNLLVDAVSIYWEIIIKKAMIISSCKLR